MASNLSLPELYKYESRRKLFIKKMKKHEPFTLTDEAGGGEVVLDVDEKLIKKIEEIEDINLVKLALKDITLKVTTKGQNVKSYRFSDLAKTKEFGGGSGSGAGSEVTGVTESAQAIYAQARWDESFKNYYSKSFLEKVFNSHSQLVTAKKEEILNEVSESWIASCILGAELLYDHFHTKFPNKKYTFHRGSQWVKELNKRFNSLNSELGNKKFANINKWSPADIWMLSSEGEKVVITEINSLQELNILLLENFRSGDIIGISLKKMKTKARLEEINVGKEKHVRFEYEGYETGSRGFFHTKQNNIFFSKSCDVVELRSYKGLQLSDFNADPKGINAHGGKISHGVLNTILTDMKLKPLTSYNDMREKLEKDCDSLYKEFYGYYTKYAKDDPKINSLKKFVERIKELGKGKEDSEKVSDSWSFSKIFGLQIIDRIETSDTKKQNEFVSRIVHRALAQSELSAPHILIK